MSKTMSKTTKFNRLLECRLHLLHAVVQLNDIIANDGPYASDDNYLVDDAKHIRSLLSEILSSDGGQAGLEQLIRKVEQEVH